MLRSKSLDLDAVKKDIADVLTNSKTGGQSGPWPQGPLH
jgi:hypothetical protein